MKYIPYKEEFFSRIPEKKDKVLPSNIKKDLEAKNKNLSDN